MLWIYTLAPTAFIFDTFTWNGAINQAYRGVSKHFGIGERAAYPFTQLLPNPGNLALLVLFISMNALAFRHHGFRRDPLTASVLTALLCIWIGALAPSVPYQQYYYALVPFLALGLLSPWPYLVAVPSNGRFVRWGFGAAAATAVLSTWHNAKDLRMLADPSAWRPLMIHRAGGELARLAPPGPILTVTPIVALEGKTGDLSRVYHRRFCLEDSGIFDG